MGALANPYILVIMLAIGAGYAITEKVKGPVKAAAHQVEKAGKKILHVVTFGKK